MRGKKDASLFRGLMKEYSCDYRLYTRKICIIRGKLKNFKAGNLVLTTGLKT